MKKIGVLSDSHGYIHPELYTFFEKCDEIWHAGDIGTTELADRFAAMKPFRAVYGNIDGGSLRHMFTEKYRFRCEDVEVLIKHIGGYPGKYDASIIRRIYANPPQLFISGHSHILKVKYDKSLNLLHINPGAAGLSGWQQQRTLVRLTIDGSTFKDLEIIELNR